MVGKSGQYTILTDEFFSPGVLKSPYLLCRYGRNNTQLIDIEESSEVLVIFSGAHTYISPQWYVSKNMVPTWNFQTVQIRGTAQIVDALKVILERLTKFHESRLPAQWSMSQLEPQQLEYVPIALLLLYALEFNKGDNWLVNLLGLSFVAGRIIHARGVLTEKLRIRVLGTQVTFYAIMGLVVTNMIFLPYGKLFSF